MGESNSNKQVLVTGGTGFVGYYCILQLLQQGYIVRTTIRSMERRNEVLTMLLNNGIKNTDDLSFFVADLTSDSGWAEAIKGCDYVLHVASPFPSVMPKDENELIIPARDGSLRVLKEAQKAGVKRVVLTSSFAAIGYGHKLTHKTFTEEDWTNLSNKKITAYVKSKTIAEKAAWDFIHEQKSLELAVINPVGIFGPLAGKDYPTSIAMLKQILDGEIKSLPQTYFSAVDVRDVADMHIKAMTTPKAAGERFLAAAGKCLSMHEAAMMVKNKLGERGKNIPTKVLSNWMVRMAALFSSRAKQLVPQLGKIKNVSNQKAKDVLGWTPRTNEEALIASAESLIKLGLVKN